MVDEPTTASSLHEDLAWVNATYASSIANTGLMLDHALSLGERIILEGAQGCLDIDQGIYPFVTSSVTSRGNATHGAGIHPGHVDEVIGITKAYITRVGNGAMPTELEDEVGHHLGTVGHEFGTTTGRKRRCGWFDAVVMRHAQRVNGFTSLALTKLDVLEASIRSASASGAASTATRSPRCLRAPLRLPAGELIYLDMPGFEAMTDEDGSIWRATPTQRASASSRSLRPPKTTSLASKP